jgi:predicted nucleic acid-binding protein
VTTIIIADTNILSSLAAAEALSLLKRLFSRSKLCVPTGVYQELQVGFDKGKTYLQLVLQAISAGEIQVLALSATEQRIAQGMPNSLNAGEREAIAVCQSRKARLLCNDKRAKSYGLSQGVKVVDLPALLRALWVRRIISQTEVQLLLDKMEKVEKLRLKKVQHQEIFAPRSK